jgi:putative membrane protein
MIKHSFRYLGNWKVLLMALLINMVSIAVTALLLPGFEILNTNLLTLALLGVGLGVVNTAVKPVFQLLTIRLVFITYGLNIIIINTIMLLLMEWLSVSMEIRGVFTAILGAILIWTISTFLDYVFGVLPPLGYMKVLREEEGQQ